MTGKEAEVGSRERAELRWTCFRSIINLKPGTPTANDAIPASLREAFVQVRISTHLLLLTRYLVQTLSQLCRLCDK